MIPLQKRKDDFAAMVAGVAVPHERPSSMILSAMIPWPEWHALMAAARLYMGRCLPRGHACKDGDIVELFEANREDIPNITPNGMIVPKRHTMMEYNILVRTFAEAVQATGVAPWISSWHVPLNVRIKFAEADEANLQRHHPTEHIHSDSWAGESSESVTVHVPLFGDCAGNHVAFYDPPGEFQEDWLGPRPSYLDGLEVAKKYRPVDFVPTAGNMVLADFATLHASSRRPGCGTRVSIDTTFHLKREVSNEKIHQWRTGERAPHSVLLGAGETHLFVFPDSATAMVDSRGGFKHPTTLSIINLLS